MGDSVWNDFLDETIEERYGLVAERVEEISKDALVPDLYKEYFSEAAAYLKKTMELCQMAKDGTLQLRSLEICKADQEQLYHHMLPGFYEESYANPAYAVAVFGEKEGELLSFLRAELDLSLIHISEPTRLYCWSCLYRCIFALRRKICRKQNRRFTGISMITVRCLWKIRYGK